MSIAVPTFIFIAVTLLAAVLFVLWMIYSVINLVVRGVSFLIGAMGGASSRKSSVMRCTRLRCGEQNPVEATYCRRCGLPLITSHTPPQARPMVMQRT